MQSTFENYYDVKELMMIPSGIKNCKFSAQIPKELILCFEQTVVYDLRSERCEIFDTIDKKVPKFWTNLASRSMLQKKKILQSDEKETTSYYVDDTGEENFKECLFFDTLHGKSVFHYIINGRRQKQQIFGSIIERVMTMESD